MTFTTGCQACPGKIGVIDGLALPDDVALGGFLLQSRIQAPVLSTTMPQSTLRLRCWSAAALAIALGGACTSTPVGPSGSTAAVPDDDPAPPITDSTDATLVWNRRTVEHLLNRAAFGGTQAEIDAALAHSPEEVVAGLFEARADWVRVEPQLVVWLEPEEIARLQLPKEVAQAERLRIRQLDSVQFLDYADAWFASMLGHDDPVRDHMALFWHGFFTTSFKVVRRKFELINQHQLLRYHALESYADLLAAIVRDPAMLQYLDNNTNVKGHPNENLARELMELFSLGEGNYTEVDVREAARALTGYNCTAYGGFAFYPEQHDTGQKTVLGVSADLDADDLVQILLDQPACARWIAGKVIAYFEGPWPSIERQGRYAALLRASNYELRPLLETLFLDPDFYRDEVVGSRVQGPIEWMVAAARKLEITPPQYYVYRATESMGQCFYNPPTVEGWHDGESWITNDTLMHRGNCIGVLLDCFELPDKAELERLLAMPEGVDEVQTTELVSRNAMEKTVHRLGHLIFPADWDATTSLADRLRDAGATSDEAIVAWMVEELLAITPPVATHDLLLDFLAQERSLRGLGRTPLLDTDGRDLVLRRLAHMLFSLPEAQLG